MKEINNFVDPNSALELVQALQSKESRKDKIAAFKDLFLKEVFVGQKFSNNTAAIFIAYDTKELSLVKSLKDNNIDVFSFLAFGALSLTQKLTLVLQSNCPDNLDLLVAHLGAGAKQEIQAVLDKDISKNSGKELQEVLDKNRTNQDAIFSKCTNYEHLRKLKKLGFDVSYAMKYVQHNRLEDLEINPEKKAFVRSYAIFTGVLMHLGAAAFIALGISFGFPAIALVLGAIGIFIAPALVVMVPLRYKWSKLADEYKAEGEMVRKELEQIQGPLLIKVSQSVEKRGGIQVLIESGAVAERQDFLQKIKDLKSGFGKIISISESLIGKKQITIIIKPLQGVPPESCHLMLEKFVKEYNSLQGVTPESCHLMLEKFVKEYNFEGPIKSKDGRLKITTMKQDLIQVDATNMTNPQKSMFFKKIENFAKENMVGLAYISSTTPIENEIASVCIRANKGKSIEPALLKLKEFVSDFKFDAPQQEIKDVGAKPSPTATADSAKDLGDQLQK